MEEPALVPHTIPLAVTAAPPSELITPPLDAELVVIALIEVVEVIPHNAGPPETVS